MPSEAHPTHSVVDGPPYPGTISNGPTEDPVSRSGDHAGGGAEPEPSLVESLLALLDDAATRLRDAPIRPRLKVTPTGLARGEVDILQVEVPTVAATGLLLDRLVVRAEHVHLALGLPPRIQAGPVSMRAYVGQRNVDRWVRTARLPVHVTLAEQGLLLSANVGGFTVSEALADLQVSGRLLRLAPKRMTVAGLPTPLVRFLRGYLPLPPLPRGARLTEVHHSEGQVAVTFALDHLDEALDPESAIRLARLLRLPSRRAR